MGQRWVENTANGPRTIGGKLLQPGEGTWLSEGPFPVDPLEFPVTASATGGQRAGRARFFPQLAPRYAMIGTSQTMNSSNPLAITSFAGYDPVTGICTVNKVNHGLVTGGKFRFGVRGRPEWFGYDLIATRVSADVFSFVAPTGLTLPSASDVRYNHTEQRSQSGILSWVQTLTEGRCRLVREAGMTGETWGQIRARIATDIAPVMTEGGFVILEGGPNDPLASNPTIPVETSIADMTGCVNDLVALGLRVILLNLSTFGAGYGTSASRIHILEQNRAAAALHDSARGVEVVDVFNITYDPATSCDAKAGFIATDLLHWGGKATKPIAQLVANVINAWFPSVPQKLPRTALDCYHATNNPNSTNRHPNALMDTTTGGGVNGMNGAAPLYFQTDSTHATKSAFTALVAPASWGVGNSLKLTWTSLTFADNTVRIFSSNALTGRFAPGEKFRLGMRIDTTGLAAAGMTRYMGLFCQATVDGVTKGQLAIAHSSSFAVAQADQSEFTNLYIEGEFQVQGGSVCTQIIWQLILFLNGTGAGSLEVGDLDSRAIT